MDECNFRITANPIYNRRARKSKTATDIILIYNISISIKRSRGRSKKLII